MVSFSSYMDYYFLDVPHLTHLDGYISQASQSIVFEVVSWTVIYLIYAAIMSRVCRFLMSQMKFWNDGSISKRGGGICANAQDDMVVFVVFGIHHFIAGSMCYMGLVNDDVNMFRHGYLLEVGFEVADVLSMILNLYPYALDNVKPESQRGLLFHHLSGIFFTGIYLNANLHYNDHFRIIAVVLLSGAAFTCFSGAYVTSINPDERHNLKKVTILMMISLAFWCYCRFYVFPSESYLLIQQVWANRELSGTWTVLCLYLSYIFYTMFSLGMAVDFGSKCIRLVKRCLDGVTPYDVDDVPPSREERTKSSIGSTTSLQQQQQKQQQRRRSSLSTTTEQLQRTLLVVAEATNASNVYTTATMFRRSVKALKDRSKEL